MKPTKNRVHCIECNRSKILFESEKKALNFIKFNAEEIKEENGRAPIRAYYCTYCGGWHVTSNAAYTVNPSSAEVVIEEYKKSLEAQEHLKEVKRQDKIDAKEQKKAEKKAKKNKPQEPVIKIEEREVPELKEIVHTLSFTIDHIQYFTLEEQKEIGDPLLQKLDKIILECPWAPKEDLKACRRYFKELGYDMTEYTLDKIRKKQQENVGQTQV